VLHRPVAASQKPLAQSTPEAHGPQMGWPPPVVPEAWQVPPTHCEPAEQEKQTSPPRPQALAFGAVWQVPWLSQHPPQFIGPQPFVPVVPAVPPLVP
jgi:hypothetical protein